MEFDLIPQFIILVSLSAIIFIIGRNISKIKDIDDDFMLEDSVEKKEKEKFVYLFKKLVGKINKKTYQKKMNLFWIFAEKTLRKIRISFLRFDNRIVSILNKLREKHVYKQRHNSAFVDKNSAKNNNDNKENITGNIERNTIYTKKKRRTPKEKEYINSIIKNPADIVSYWKLGLIYSRRKNYKDAVSCFRQILKIDPTYVKARKKIVDLVKKYQRGNKTSHNKRKGSEL